MSHPGRKSRQHYFNTAVPRERCYLPICKTSKDAVINLGLLSPVSPYDSSHMMGIT
ncbi:12986_t:CDS:2, partial [Ambispora gerdemannii]